MDLGIELDLALERAAPGSRSGPKPMPVTATAPASLPPPPRMARPAEAADEEGSLSVTSPIRILYRLAVEKAQGLLIVEGGESVTKEIFFSNGAPEFVSSNVAKELLGEYLVSQKVISQGELAMALAMMPHFGGKLGDTLVGLGLMRPLDVFRHLTRQVREKIIDVCTWGRGTYRWYGGRRNSRESFPLGLDAFEVLGAGATVIANDVIETWAKALLDHAPRAAKNTRVVPEAFRLGTYPREVYNRLDGRLTLRQFLTRFTTVDDQMAFLRTLFLLVQTDLAHL